MFLTSQKQIGLRDRFKLENDFLSLKRPINNLFHGAQYWALPFLFSILMSYIVELWPTKFPQLNSWPTEKNSDIERKNIVQFQTEKVNLIINMLFTFAQSRLKKQNERYALAIPYIS